MARRWTRREALKDLEIGYQSPPHPVSFSGVESIRRHYGGVLTSEEIEEFLTHLDTFVIHRGLRRPTLYSPVFVRAPREIISADLFEFKDMKRYNKGHGYVLLAVDNFTKKIWCRPLKNKKSTTVAAAFRGIVEDGLGRFDKLVTDDGGEFYGAPFRQYVQSIGARMFLPRVSGKAVAAERAIQTIKNRLGRYMTFTSRGTFLPQLQNVVDAVNNSYHRALRDTPTNVENDAEAQQKVRLLNEERYSSLKKRPNKFHEEDLVRISLLRGTFGRGFKQKFSPDLYLVHKTHLHLPTPLYTLSNIFGTEVIKGRFRQSELRRAKLSKKLHIKKVIAKEGPYWTVTFHNLPANRTAKLHAKNIAP
jgi:hypothetical protein